MPNTNSTPNNPGGPGAPLTVTYMTTSYSTEVFVRNQVALEKRVPWREKYADLLQGLKIFLGIVTWYVGSIYAQQLSFWRDSTSGQLHVYSDLVDIASAMIVEMQQPAPAGDVAGATSKEANLTVLTKRFETLYWGRMTLAGTPGLSACLKALRLSLINSDKKINAVYSQDEIYQLRSKLNYVAVALRGEYRHAAASWFPIKQIFSDPPDDGDVAGCQKPAG